MNHERPYRRPAWLGERSLEGTPDAVRDDVHQLQPFLAFVRDAEILHEDHAEVDACRSVRSIKKPGRQVLGHLFLEAFEMRVVGIPQLPGGSPKRSGLHEEHKNGLPPVLPLRQLLVVALRIQDPFKAAQLLWMALGEVGRAFAQHSQKKVVENHRLNIELQRQPLHTGLERPGLGPPTGFTHLTGQRG